MSWVVSGSGLSYNDYDNNYSNSNVSSHLCKFFAAQTLPTWQKMIHEWTGW